jgi:hypothetical protein
MDNDLLSAFFDLNNSNYPSTTSGGVKNDNIITSSVSKDIVNTEPERGSSNFVGLYNQFVNYKEVELAI